MPFEPNPEEVGDTRWVGQEELRSMMRDPELRWSPWFEGIMERKGWHYWNNLDAVIEGKGEGFRDLDVHAFGPGPEHMASFHTGNEAEA